MYCGLPFKSSMCQIFWYKSFKSPKSDYLGFLSLTLKSGKTFVYRCCSSSLTHLWNYLSLNSGDDFFGTWADLNVFVSIIGQYRKILIAKEGYLSRLETNYEATYEFKSWPSQDFGKSFCGICIDILKNISMQSPDIGMGASTLRATWLKYSPIYELL